MENKLKIYFINLEHNRDRWENNKNKLSNFHRFNAIYGKNLDKNKLIAEGVLSKKNHLKPGSIGCAMSHIEVMKLIKNQKEKYGLILEDDVLIPSNFSQTFIELEPYFPNEWDIIFLGGCNVYGRKYNNKFLIPTKKCCKHNVCCHAVLLKNDNIDKVLNSLTPLQTPIDVQLRSNFGELKAFYVYPNIFNQNKELESSRRILDGLSSKTKSKLHENITIVE